MRIPTTILAALTIAAVAAGCDYEDPGATTPVEPTTATPDQPRTALGAKEAATEYLDLYAAGKYGASWDEWTSPAKLLITREQYEKLHELCPPIAGAAAFEVGKVRLVRGVTAIVSVTRAGVAATVRFEYERSRWRWVPQSAAMRDYNRLHAGKTTVAKLAAQARRQGFCET